ncbi:MAG: DUF1569 domain-containing protein [Ignavibacteriales bacterium]|nr:DUF1569 domain-containing protein [Ignavibacteriales bacterium]
MKTLYQKEVVDGIINRVNKLSPNIQRQWGKMNVDQMLAHCSIGLETAIGTKFFPQLLIGKLIGKFFKSSGVGEKPIKKNSPTNPAFIIKNPEAFENEKQNLIGLINQFHQGGEAKCTTNPHSFFGKLTPAEWGSLQYKHLDHHLTQFGV